MSKTCSQCGQEIKSVLCKITSKPLILDPTDGTETLANANDLFSHIDPDFNNWGTNKKGASTQQQFVDVYEMTNDATFAEMFGSLSNNPDQLCLTQAQIKQFVKKHRDKLCIDGFTTFFLFKGKKMKGVKSSQLFVAGVGVVSGGGLWVSVHRFGRSFVWPAGDRLRVVVPQLA